MKKMIIGIIIGIIVTLVIVTVTILVYTKFFMFVPDKGGMINQDIEPTGDIKTYEDSVEFKGMTVSQWREKIRQYHNRNPKDIYCYYDSSEFIAIVYNEKDEEVAHYRFDDETGYALDTISGDVVDLLEGKTVEVSTTYGTTVKFIDNQFLAIGYVPDIHLEEFVNNNFVSEDDFKMLSVNDFRHEDEIKEGNGNRFVFIPKTSDVKVEVYDCFINDKGELELDNTLISNTVGSFVLLDDYMPESTTPTMCIKLKYHGFEDIIPIVFSGKDGKLDLTGHEMEVLDISPY